MSRQAYTNDAGAQEKLRAFAKQQRRNSVEALKSIMGNAGGRRFVADLLDSLESRNAPLWTSSAAELGRRAALHDEAKRLRGLLETKTPAQYLELLAEDQAARTALSAFKQSVGATQEHDDDHED